MSLLKRNLEYFLIAVGIVMIWRGVWGLLDIYLFPNTPSLSFVVSIILGAILLLFINPRKRDLEELA